MRDLRSLSEYKKILKEFKDYYYDETCEGMFEIAINGNTYFIIASVDEGWQHVSVSGLYNVMPSWDIMEIIKNKFFNDDEFVVEFHPKKEDYVNNKENCLHMWSPLSYELPYPDLISIKKNKPKVVNKKAFNVGGTPYSYEHFVSDSFEYVVVTSGFNKRPTWDAACKIKQEVFGDTVAVSYHAKKGDPLYKQNKNKLDQLIIWRPTKEQLLTPDSSLVGVKGKTEEEVKDLSYEEVLEML